MLAADLAVDGLRPFPAFERAERWRDVERRIGGRPFLHSEGLSTVLGAPQRIGGALLGRCREVVARFDRFYRGVIDTWYRTPARRPEYLVNPLFDAALDADPDLDCPLPLSRLDVVLAPSGELRVIEMNPIGVCTLHLQNAQYLARWMARLGLTEDARLLEQLEDARVEVFRRALATTNGASQRPTVGLLTLPSMHRGSRVLWRESFERRGWHFVHGTPREVSASEAELRLRGERIDVLWGDFVFHLGYQYPRYRNTRWASRLGDYRDAPAETARVLDDPAVLSLLRRRVAAQLTPPRSYLALSKHLLSWIHRDDAPVAGDRAWLAAHVARTIGVADRREGLLSVEDAVARRESLVLKPCQYGGAHGVVVGVQMAAEEWRRRMESIWLDDGWVLQDYHQPARTPWGDWMSLGLYNYGGRLGGVTIRCAPSLVVSARSSVFIAAVADGD